MASSLKGLKGIHLGKLVLARSSAHAPDHTHAHEHTHDADQE
jgi:hypothetical protein